MNRPMEKNWKYRNRPKIIWEFSVCWRCPLKTEKQCTGQYMAQKQLNSHLEQIEVGLMYATRMNAKWINNLNVKKMKP